MREYENQSKTHTRVPNKVEDFRPGKKVAAYRKRLGLTQAEFAESLGTNQKTLSRWEKAIKPMPVEGLLAMSLLVPEIDRGYWETEAGLKPAPVSPRDPLQVPVLHDAAAAGSGRAIDETEVDYRITFPAHVLPHGGKLYGLRVKGDSMAPRLGDGDIVIVDVASRDVKRLYGRMVAARDEDGVTIKWLRRVGDQVLLMPENLTGHNVRIMNKDRSLAIVGEVVKYISEPPCLEELR